MEVRCRLCSASTRGMPYIILSIARLALIGLYVNKANSTTCGAVLQTYVTESNENYASIAIQKTHSKIKHRIAIICFIRYDAPMPEKGARGPFPSKQNIITASMAEKNAMCGDVVRECHGRQCARVYI